jgi:hypothetical protein
MAAFVLIGVVLVVVNDRPARPEGVAEDWLTAISDTTRKGVGEDATRRAQEIGPLELAADLLPTADTDGKSAFEDLEVGKAVQAQNETVRVPFQVHVRDVKEAKVGTIVLARQPDGGYRVVALDARRAGERVPSEGGDPPSSAPPTVWVAGLLIGLLVTVGCTALIRWAGGRGLTEQSAISST